MLHVNKIKLSQVTWSIDFIKFDKNGIKIAQYLKKHEQIYIF